MRCILSIFVISTFVSCSASRNTKTFLTNIQKSTCNQENTYHYEKNDIPKPLYGITIDSSLVRQFNFRDLNIANAIGVLDLLSEYVQTKQKEQKDNSLQNQINSLKVSQELNHRIDLASLEISSVTAELDCEEERLNQIASFLSEKEKRRETHLTVGSIILGSLSAIVTGVLISNKDQSNAADMIGVGVGVADATLGIMMLTGGNQKIEIEHKRNVLKEIWYATETSTIYPPSIWYYLNYHNPGQNDISLREQLIKNWMDFGQIKDTRGKQKHTGIEIYFGESGNYTVDELENRANMYDQIESVIKLMKQDLRNLTLSVGKLK